VLTYYAAIRLKLCKLANQNPSFKNFATATQTHDISGVMMGEEGVVDGAIASPLNFWLSANC